MRPFPVRPAPVLALLVAGGAALATAPSGAGAATFTPDCVKPGATITSSHEFSSTPGEILATGETSLRPNVWRTGDGVVELEAESTVQKLGRGPISNAPDPNVPTYFIPTFTKVDTVPATLSYGGEPIVNYTSSITPYGANGQDYENSDTFGRVFIDLKRVLMLDKTVTVTKRSDGASVAVLVTGFRRSVVYAHVISGGKTLRHQKLGKATGPSTCGQSFEQVVVDGAKPGKLKVIVNTSRKSAKGGVSATIKVKR